jgi:hypothetical protein
VKKGAIAGAASAVALSAIGFLIEMYLLSPRGFPVSVHPPMALFFPIALCAFLFPIACILLAPRATRRIAETAAAFCAAYVVAGLLGMIATDRARKYTFARLGSRSAGLVTAIHAFEVDHRRPPSSLHELVPGYLPAVPRTGMGAYPDYYYKYEARDDGGWRLWVPATEGPFSWDSFVYDPYRREWRYLTD